MVIMMMLLLHASAMSSIKQVAHGTVKHPPLSARGNGSPSFSSPPLPRRDLLRNFLSLPASFLLPAAAAADTASLPLPQPGAPWLLNRLGDLEAGLYSRTALKASDVPLPALPGLGSGGQKELVVFFHGLEEKGVRAGSMPGALLMSCLTGMAVERSMRLVCGYEAGVLV